MTVHAKHPYGDGDKAVCGVRFSEKPTRVVAAIPNDLTCEGCILRVLRTWQQNCNETLESILEDGRWETVWPWDDPSHRKD